MAAFTGDQTEAALPNTSKSRNLRAMSQALSTAKRKAREREKKRAAGLRPIEIWCRPEDADEIRQYAAELRKRCFPNGID